MKTIFDLYELSARRYNENLYTLQEEPETVDALGVGCLYALLQDLRVRMNTLEEVYELSGGTFIKKIGNHGYIEQITLRNPQFSCTMTYDYETQRFNAQEYNSTIDKTSTP